MRQTVPCLKLHFDTSCCRSEPELQQFLKGSRAMPIIDRIALLMMDKSDPFCQEPFLSFYRFLCTAGMIHNLIPMYIYEPINSPSKNPTRMPTSEHQPSQRCASAPTTNTKDTPPHQPPCSLYHQFQLIAHSCHHQWCLPTLRNCPPRQYGCFVCLAHVFGVDIPSFAARSIRGSLREGRQWQILL